MNGYVYITGKGADPGAGGYLKDPIFGPVPTLGACMPNIRRNVSIGDWIFVVSGKIERFAQYVIGGMQVQEKIKAIEAYERYPSYRLSRRADGSLSGNVVVTQAGEKHPLDTHPVAGFDRRVQNFIVGGKYINLVGESEIERGRAETLPILQRLTGKVGNRPIDVIGRSSKLDDAGVDTMLDWLTAIKEGR